MTFGYVTAKHIAAMSRSLAFAPSVSLPLDMKVSAPIDIGRSADAKGLQ